MTGRVLQVESQWDAATTTIVTYVDIAVDRYIRGERHRGAPRPQTARRARRRASASTFADQARFAVGERGAAAAGGQPARRLAAHRRTGPRQAARPTPTAIAHGRIRTARRRSGAVRRGPGRTRRSAMFAPAFAFLPTDGGYPARWHEVDDDGAVFVDHPSSLPGTWTGSPANVTAAINLWRSSGMELDLRDRAAATCRPAPARLVLRQRPHRRRLQRPGCGIADEADNWVVGGGYYTTGDLRTVNGTTFQKFIQGFVVLNNAGPQSGSAGCFQDAITHGLGHALGPRPQRQRRRDDEPAAVGFVRQRRRAASAATTRRASPPSTAASPAGPSRRRRRRRSTASAALSTVNLVVDRPRPRAARRSATSSMPATSARVSTTWASSVLNSAADQRDLRRRAAGHLLRPGAGAERDRHQRSVARGAGRGRRLRRARAPPGR